MAVQRNWTARKYDTVSFNKVFMESTQNGKEVRRQASSFSGVTN